ncbi:MAG: RNA 3'-terminal phosphate cyclase [Candidatus Aenigmarchaeota archaeon]|nr:RNA 3'-terminal phosphate cyclase [Candidatus Aenigmarchaeota archaeon]
MEDIVVVDGSHGEGGGQVIRTSVALSALTGKPVRITNIRAKRCTSGLRAQHVSGVDAVAQMCNAEVKGASVGSEKIDFFPENIETKHLSVKISTAGSIGLVLQALLIPAMHIKDRIEIDICGGATFGKWSPPLLYTKHVLFPILLKMGYRAEMEIVKHGHYPKGGAEVKVVIHPLLKLKGIDLSESGKLLKICGIAHSSGQLRKAQVSEREAESAKVLLLEKYDVPVEIEACYSDTESVGTSIVLWAEFENTVMGADCLGAVGVKAEKVGVLAAEQLSGYIDSGASVDEYMTDQLPPYIAFASGPSSYTAPSFTGHAKTNIDVVGKFLDRKFDVDEKDGIVKISVS